MHTWPHVTRKCEVQVQFLPVLLLLSLSEAGFDTDTLLYPISFKLSGFLHFKRRLSLQQDIVENAEVTRAVFLNNYFIYTIPQVICLILICPNANS